MKLLDWLTIWAYEAKLGFYLVCLGLCIWRLVVNRFAHRALKQGVGVLAGFALSEAILQYFYILAREAPALQARSVLETPWFLVVGLSTAFFFAWLLLILVSPQEEASDAVTD